MFFKNNLICLSLKLLNQANMNPTPASLPYKIQDHSPNKVKFITYANLLKYFK